MQKEYDLLVTGAGIYGAWTAYDAAMRGLKVLIIDKGDIACSTSSSSSKLIHGGLRYLEQFNFSLVKKSVVERQRLMTLAPHLVQPLKFGIPVYEKTRVKAWKFKLGLWLYDWLADLKGDEFKHESLPNTKFADRFPFLKKANLKKGFTYTDARTDDARYALEIVDGAVKSGAELRTYWALSEYIENNGQVSGALLTDIHTGVTEEISCKAAVNATGRFTDELLNTDDCRLSKGIHLILPEVNSKEAMLLISPEDGRVFFVIPWYGRTMVGTTDTDYNGDLNHVQATEDDIIYLLNSVNHFMEKPWNREDVIASFAGLRVLKKSSDGAHPSSVKRDWECKVLKNGLFISAGGKFTSARQDCSEMVDKICRQLKIDEKCETDNRPFPWTPEAEYNSWIENLRETAGNLISKKYFNLLLRRQGKRAEKIISMIISNPDLANPVVESLPFTKAEWIYVLKNEYCKCFSDLIRRRFPVILLTKLSEEQLTVLFEDANRILSESGLTELKR